MDKSVKKKRFITSIFGISLLLSVFAFIIFFVLPLLKSDRKSWVVGPMSSSHKFIESDCASCHATSFSPIKDQSCMSCHNVSVHPEIHSVELEHEEAKDYRALQPSCVTCHLEHSGDQGLVISDPRTCISCHGNLKSHFEKTKLRNVLDFKSHPEFSLPKVDQAKIKLNHEVHLKKNLRAENGYKTLTCGDCHQVGETQQLMKEVNYERNCRSCHKLELDGKKELKTIPHVDADSVFDFMYKEYLSRYYTKNKSVDSFEIEDLRQRPGLTPEQERVVTEVLRSTRDFENEIFMDRGCALCHFVNKKESSVVLNEGQSQFEIEKLELPKKWFPNSDFNHQSHEILTCESCHEGVRKSSKTEDVNMPKIKDCNSCHSKKGGASEDCTTCHSYHKSLGLSEGKKRKESAIIFPH